MPPPYIHPHWIAFANTTHQQQGPVGLPPSVWVTNYGINGVPNQSALPNFQLDRNSVTNICLNPSNNVLFCYVCAMAWGGQGGGPDGRAHVLNAWKNHLQIIPTLTALRAGGLTRGAAYNLFQGANAVGGLGPSFFTKLLYFFTPSPSFYIMDQWTAKSINLLTGNWVTRMTGNVPSNLNKGGNYQAFCEEVDLMAGMLGIAGHVAEERLFSQGGRHRWPWRSHVHSNWPQCKPPTRYSSATLHGVYPHIPLNDF
jgi:hypothetical protein